MRGDLTRQHNTRQDEATRGNTRQDTTTTRQDKIRHHETRQDKTRHDKTRQDKTRQDNRRQERTWGPSGGCSCIEYTCLLASGSCLCIVYTCLLATVVLGVLFIWIVQWLTHIEVQWHKLHLHSGRCIEHVVLLVQLERASSTEAQWPSS